MAKSPAFPQNNDKDRPPFLNDGKSTVEFVNGVIADGPPNDPVPAYVFDLKVVESTNPMNFVDHTHTVRVKCKGFSWGKTVQEIISAAALVPKGAVSPEVAEALFQTGKLKGRKFEIVQETKTKPTGASWREYRCVPLEKTAVV